MEEDFFDDELISRFEEMLSQHQINYFDVEEFEEIISYYLDLLDFNYAAQALDLAKVQHPLSIEVKIKEIEILLALEDLLKAYFLINRLKPLEENYPQLLSVQGKYWSLRESPLKSIYFYKKALGKDTKEDPEITLELYVSLGDEYLSLKETARALYYFEKALEMDPQDEYIFYSCISCLDEVYLYEECIHFLNQFINKNPYHQKAWYELGIKYVSISNYDKAIEALDYAILIEDTFLEAYREKAEIFEKIKYYKKAIEVYKELLILDNSSDLNYKIGICYKQIKDYSSAFEYLQLALKGDPLVDKAYFEMALMCEKLEDYKKANEYLLEALSLDCENFMYWKKSIDLNLRLNLYKDVLNSYEKALFLDSSNYHLWISYIEFLIDRKKYKKVISVIEQLNWFDINPSLYYYNAYCYFFLKEETKGFLELSKGLKKSPSFLKKIIKKYPDLLKKRSIKKILNYNYIV